MPLARKSHDPPLTRPATAPPSLPGGSLLVSALVQFSLSADIPQHLAWRLAGPWRPCLSTDRCPRCSAVGSPDLPHHSDRDVQVSAGSRGQRAYSVIRRSGDLASQCLGLGAGGLGGAARTRGVELKAELNSANGSTCLPMSRVHPELGRCRDQRRSPGETKWNRLHTITMWR